MALTQEQQRALDRIPQSRSTKDGIRAIHSAAPGEERDRVAASLGYEKTGEGRYNRGPGVLALSLLAGGALAGGGLLAGAGGAGAGAAGVGSAGTAAGTAAGSGALSRVGGFLKNNWRDVATGAGTAYSAVKGAQNQGRSNELSDAALQLALADYEDRKPLREAFTRGAMTPIAQAPDLSSVFSAARSDNPFATGGAPRSAHVPSQIGPPPALSPMAQPKMKRIGRTA